MFGAFGGFMNKIFIVLLFSIIYGCSDPVVMHTEGEGCSYDTECVDGLSCINSICTTTQECIYHSDCIEKEDCIDNSCLCKLGKCTPYFPCESERCEENEICNDISSYPFFECICDDHFQKNNGICEFDCSNLEHSHTNSSNSGCSCDENYIPQNGECSFNCSDFSLKETNSTNDGCSCKTEYEEIAGDCIFICEDSHSSVNDTNDGCNCELGYIKDENNKCKYDCGNDINSIVTETNDGCVCKDGYQLKNGICTFICGEHSSINDTNNGCNCETGYFFNLYQSECINPCTEDSCGTDEFCVATSYNEFTCESIERCDPNPCFNGATCTNEATSYVCNCTVGHTGVNCQKDIERKYCALSGKTNEGEPNIDTDIDYSIINNYNINSFVSEKTVNLDISQGEISLVIAASKMNWGGDRADMTLIFKNAQDAQVLKLFLDLNNYTTDNHWYLYDANDLEIMHVSGKKDGKTYGGAAYGDLKISANKIEFIDRGTASYSIKEFSYNIDLSSVKTVTLTLNALGTYRNSGHALSCITIPYCGNGVKQSGEACDDGNLIDGDGCSSSCEIE